MLAGRDAERAAIAALLDAARSSRGGALVIRGVAGSGKSTLLADAVGSAVGMTVLRTQGVESESPLAFASLQRLLWPLRARLQVAERAAAELPASGETARRRDVSTTTELSPQERQVTALIRQGLPTRDVAAQMFLSPRTVDFHLRNIFVKLGVSSRAELAALPLSRQ